MSLSVYKREMRRYAKLLWNSNIDKADFIGIYVSLIKSGFIEAWNTGARECGIAPSELTADESGRLQREILSEVQHVVDLSYWIFDHSWRNGGDLDSIYSRIEMWTNRYSTIQSLAMTYACGDSKLMWAMSPLKEHCVQCLTLHGRVYRASVWKKYGLYPRMRGLECGGWRCGCEFIVTDAPVTSGYPPYGNRGLFNLW